MLIHLVPVCRVRSDRSAQMRAALFRRGDALGLALPCGQSLLLGDAGKHFYQDVVYHVEHPLLTFGQLNHGRGQVNHTHDDVPLLEVPQLLHDMLLAAAEPVEGLYDQRVALAQYGVLERLIPGAL